MEQYNKAGYSILVVDDNLHNIKVVTELLRNEGYSVICASTGSDAIDIVKNCQVDLILLDIMMPEIDGFEVAAQLKDNPDTSAVPVIFLTARTDDHSIETAFALGAVDYITKPIRSLELVARVRTHLQLKASRDEVVAAKEELEISHQKLLAKEESLITILESIQSGIILFDIELQTVLDVNSSSCAILNMIPDAIHSLSLNDIFGEKTAQRIISSIVDGFGEEFECSILSDKEEIFLAVTTSSITVHDVESGLISISNITSRKKEEQLRNDIERITRHDLKTPLNGIIGIPELLIEDENLTEDQLTMLKLVRESGYSMLKIINLSTDMFKMEQGEYELFPSPVNLFKVIETIEQELQDLADAYEVFITKTARGKVVNCDDECILLSEELLLYSMLANLIKNAIEASSPEDAVTIAVDCNENDILITVHNTGAVPEEIRERFFDKYVTHGKRTGTGLGTYSAQLITKTLGGSIGLQSDTSTGTTVSVSLSKTTVET